MDSLIALDDSCIRTFKALAGLLMNLHDHQRMEGYLRHLVILQLRAGNLREGREGLNQLVVNGNDGLYLDLLNLLNEAMIKGSMTISKKPVRSHSALNWADSYQKIMSRDEMPLGVSLWISGSV